MSLEEESEEREDEGEGSLGEESRHRYMQSMRKKVVLDQEWRLWSRAKGDGVADGGNQ